MKILLVNLTRFGDLLQSQAAISALAAQAAAAFGPSGSVETPSSGETPDSGGLGLVCLANFAFSAGFLRGLKHTFPLPRDAFLSGLSQAGATAPPSAANAAASNENWLESLAGLWQWRAEIWNSFKPDLVCNLTPTVPARLLSAYLAGGAPLIGFGLDESGFAQDGPWATFLRSATRARFASPFNVIDLFRAVAGQRQNRNQPEIDNAALRPRPQLEVTQASQRLQAAWAEQNSRAAAARQQPRGFVAFQLGASEERRRWPLEYFAELGRGLWQAEGWVPVLLGSKGELELSRRYAELNASLAKGETAAPPFISLLGETSLEELAGVLENCALLVSNDTGTLHLAAGLGRPVLGIFLATAQPWDTGPGLPGSLSLEPDLPCHPCAFGQECPHDLRCRRAIKPQAVLELVMGYLKNGCWPETPAKAAAKSQKTGAGARLWLTRKDSAGMLDLRSLSGHGGEPRSVWMRAQRHFLSQFLDRDPKAEFHLQAPNGATGGEPNGETNGQAEKTSESKLLTPTNRAALLAELHGLATQLELLLAQGRVLLVKSLPQFRQRFLQSVRRISQAFESSQFFPALGLLWRAEVEEQGGDLGSALACAAQYQNLVNGLYQEFTPD